MKRGWLCLLLALVSLSTDPALAASIAVLRPASSAPALTEALHRLKGELFALGLDVRIVDRPPSRAASDEAEADGFSRMAAELGIDALIVVSGETRPSAVDVWIFEPSSRRSRVTRVVLEPNAANAAETLAIRAIEVLRSNFVEIDLAARARTEAPPVAPPPEAVPPVAREERPEQPSPAGEGFGVEAGISVIASLDGVGPALLPLVRFDWAPASWLVAQATLAGLGTRPTLETAAGSATIAQTYGLVGLGFSPWLDFAARPFVSFSAGALHTSLEGHADSPEQGHSVSQWSLLFDAAIGARWRVSDRYYLTPAFHVELAHPYVAVHFVDEEVASSGNPNLVGSFTFGAWL
ncbi:MAG TPA: hypothetical protein VFZ53_35040 [Polyangiaceae bacterium]